MKTVIEMAREAGWQISGSRVSSPVVEGSDLARLLERFAALVREDEREKQQEPVAYLYEGVLFLPREATHYIKDYGTPVYAKPVQLMKQEPVAWRNAIKHWAFDCAWGDLTERQIDDLELLVTGILNAAPVDAKAIREALADHVEQNLTMVADHSGDSNKMVAEPAIPEWVDVDDYEEPVKQEPVACGCGATAYCLIRHTNLPEHNFTPICLSCLQEHEQNAQEVNEHEMHNFGGAYGLVTWETKPLYAAPVRTKDLTDDEIEAIHGCPPAEWVRRFARAVIAADREKNRG